MASAQTNVDIAPPPASAWSSLLISLVSLSQEALETTLANIAAAFPGQKIMVATPDSYATATNSNLVQLLPYAPPAANTTGLVLTAADYLNTYKLLSEQHATTCVLLGTGAESISPGVIRALAESAASADLSVAHYELRPREGLVNSAILYPATRALFSTRPRFPLALDLGISRRMAERLAAVAQRSTSSGQNDAILWPVSEAASNGYSITEVEATPRAIPQPPVADLNTLLAYIAGSFFAEIDAKAAFWQRARGIQSARNLEPSTYPAEAPPDIGSMLNSFRLGFTNLHEIWSLVLPPNSLLGLKRLSVMPAEIFRMPDALWTRIVYDFVLAYRLRTINRGHLMGALTPLYLGWVASHLNLISNGTAPEKHVEDLAVAFESDKPYLVSRWRWPDRFNP